MTGRIERTIRVIDDGQMPRPVEYWRTRPLGERLAEVLSLHREGNRLFKGGDPDFVFEIRPRHVLDPA